MMLMTKSIYLAYKYHFFAELDVLFFHKNGYKMVNNDNCHKNVFRFVFCFYIDYHFIPWLYFSFNQSVSTCQTIC